MSTIDPKDYLFLPPRAIQVANTEFERRLNNISPLTFGVPVIDTRFVPLLDGDLTGFLARPSMGKTYDMMMLANHHALMLASLYPDDPPLVIYATWETTVEEFIGVFSSKHTGYTLSDIGRGTANLTTLKHGLVKLMGTNFAVFGKSVTLAHAGVRMPSPSVMDLALAIRSLQDDGHKVAVVFMDYLQRIPDQQRVYTMDGVQSRVSGNLESIKEDLCMVLGLPVVVGIQAARQVDKYPGIKLPLMDDGQWTSNIEQTCDKLMSITRPGVYQQPGYQFIVNGKIYVVTNTTKVIRMIKQRFESAQNTDIWVLQYDPVQIAVTEQQPTGDAPPPDVDDQGDLSDVV